MVTKNSGFTLLELVLYVGLMGAMVVAVSLMISIILQTRVKNQTIVEVQQAAQLITQTMTQQIRNSTGINSPIAGNSAATLSLNTTDAGVNPIVFDLASGKIRMTQGASSAVNLNSGRIIVSDLSFANVPNTGAPSVIKFQFTLTRLNPQTKYEYDYSQTFYATAALRK